MYIKRHLEEVIRECLEQFPIVLVTGPRQIGKTILLKNVCSEYKYVTLEDIFVLIEAIEETNLFLKNYQPPVFIDEVQYAPSIFRYLKMYVDTNKQKGSFALTGSQAFELMKGVSETLAGRMAIGCNSSYISRIMKQELGISFKDFLTRLRISQAVRLMEDRELSINQIAEKVGYSNQHYFSAAFKNCQGMSPSEFRKNMLQIDRNGL
mgnify:CR=1 FL=1